jgi:hypothetical protein
MTNSDQQSSHDVTTVTGLLKIFFLIVLVNIVLYISVVYFTVVLFHRTVPVFLAFVQFLAFILPIVFILRIGLKEAPEAGGVENPFLKQIGATPSLVILSCFAALLATFTPISAQIFPKPDPFPKSMIAKVGLACRISSDLTPSKAAYLLTVIWADDTDYIGAVRDNLRSLQIAASNSAKDQHDAAKSTVYEAVETILVDMLKWFGPTDATTRAKPETTFAQLKVVNNSSSDQFYNLLKRSTPTAEVDPDLRGELSDDTRWAAFTVPVKAPEDFTQVPIHTRFGMRNHTKVFLLTFPEDNGPDSISGDPLTAGAPALPRGVQPQEFRARKIAEVEILSTRPDSETQGAELNLNIFHTNTCWTSSPTETVDVD